MGEALPRRNTQNSIQTDKKLACERSHGRNKRTYRWKESAHIFSLHLSEIRTMYSVVTALDTIFIILFLPLHRSVVGFVHAQFLGNGEEEWEKNQRILFQHKQYHRTNHPASNAITRTNKRYFKIYS